MSWGDWADVWAARAGGGAGLGRGDEGWGGRLCLSVVGWVGRSGYRGGLSDEIIESTVARRGDGGEEADNRPCTTPSTRSSPPHLLTFDRLFSSYQL